MKIVEHSNYQAPNLPKDCMLTNEFKKVSFASLLDRVEGTKIDELTDKQIKELAEKYPIQHMSEEDEVNLMGDLVEYGVFTKQEAIDILVGFVPGPIPSYNDPYGTFTTSADNHVPDSESNVDILMSYKKLMDLCITNMRNLSHASVDMLSAKNSYNSYIYILEKISAENKVHLSLT